MSSSNCFLACVVTCAVAVSTVKTAAASGSDALTDKARVLYDEAALAYQKSDWAAARASLLAAWSLKKHWQIAASLGDCEVQLGLYREAAEHLAYFMRLSPSQPPSAETKALFAKATSKLGALAITVDVTNADVVVDGNFVGKSPIEDPVFVEPGHHSVEARLGAERATDEADLLAGSSRRLSFALTNTTFAHRVDSQRPSHALVISAAVVSAAAVGTGIAFLAFAGGKENEADSVLLQLKSSAVTCLVPPQAGSCARLLLLRQDQGRFHNVGVPLLAGGAVGALGTTIYALWPRAKRPTTASVTVLPAIGSGSTGMWLTGAF